MAQISSRLLLIARPYITRKVCPIYTNTVTFIYKSRIYIHVVKYFLLIAFTGVQLDTEIITK